MLPLKITAPASPMVRTIPFWILEQTIPDFSSRMYLEEKYQTCASKCSTENMRSKGSVLKWSPGTLTCWHDARKGIQQYLPTAVKKSKMINSTILLLSLSRKQSKTWKALHLKMSIRGPGRG